MKPGKPDSGGVDWGSDDKTQPCKPYYRPYKANGTQSNNVLKDFNEEGKIENTKGSDYHSLNRPDSGLHGNFAEKDANVEALKEIGKKGMQVRHFSATSRESKMDTNNVGLTAYNSRPIPEVYKPATSGHVPPPDAVTYKTKKKSLNP